jgi:LmbE family N-acetylglucosaminyl deacetylase
MPPVTEKELNQAFQREFRNWLRAADSPPLPSSSSVLRAGNLLNGVQPGRVLVLSPHPDDELIGCGGTLLELQRIGWKIHVIQMTEGITCKALRNVPNDIGRNIRWKEARQVAQRFSWEMDFWSTGNDGSLDADSKTIARLRAHIDSVEPGIIFVPSSTDLHPEHRLANYIAQQIENIILKPSLVLEYPVWGFLPNPSLAIDVSRTHDEVLDALYIYHTAMKAEDYVSRCRTMAEKIAVNLGLNNCKVELFSMINRSTTELIANHRNV